MTISRYRKEYPWCNRRQIMAEMRQLGWRYVETTPSGMLVFERRAG